MRLCRHGNTGIHCRILIQLSGNYVFLPDFQLYAINEHNIERYEISGAAPKVLQSPCYLST